MSSERSNLFVCGTLRKTPNNWTKAESVRLYKSTSYIGWNVLVDVIRERESLVPVKSELNHIAKS